LREAGELVGVREPLDLEMLPAELIHDHRKDHVDSPGG